MGFSRLNGGGASLNATLESMYVHVLVQVQVRLSLGLIVRWSPISIYFFGVKSPRQGPFVSGVIGNNRSKGKIRVSKHGSHDPVGSKVQTGSECFFGAWA